MVSSNYSKSNHHLKDLPICVYIHHEQLYYIYYIVRMSPEDLILQRVYNKKKSRPYTLVRLNRNIFDIHKHKMIALLPGLPSSSSNWTLLSTKAWNDLILDENADFGLLLYPWMMEMDISGDRARRHFIGLRAPKVKTQFFKHCFVILFTQWLVLNARVGFKFYNWKWSMIVWKNSHEIH